MLYFRISDWIIQLVIMSSIIILRLTGDIVGAAGMFAFLGCWQVGSAAINTYGFTRSPLARKIWLYWLFAFIDLFLAFSNISIYVSVAGMIGAGLTAIWYAVILKQLIGFNDIKRVSRALLKNKTHISRKGHLLF